MIAIAYTLAGLIAAAIIFIGARFIVAPRAAAAGYGVRPDLGQPTTTCLPQHQGRTRHRIRLVRRHPDGCRRDAPARMGHTRRHDHSARRRRHRARQWRLEVDRLGSPGATAVVMLMTSALLLLS